MMTMTNVLLKVFGWRFYRENSGLLLFSYVSLISYCFFIKTVGNYQPEESVFYHLMLMMTFIVSPLIMLLVFALYLIYTIKSWQYVGKQLKLESNQFLFYSITASARVIQFKTLFCVQLIISLPLIGYWLFATILGIIFKANIIPLITLAYILILAVISALLYQHWLNAVRVPGRRSILGKISERWYKPVSSLFLYYLVRNQKASLLLTKLCSCITIIGLYNAFQENETDQRVGEMIVLGIVMAHSFLIYKEHYFKEISLSFLRNMPYRRIAVWLNFALVFSVIILPEIIWVLSRFELCIAVKTILLGVSIAMVFRSLIYITGLQIYKYLTHIFFLFIVQFYVIVFNYSDLLIVLNFAIAFAVFYEYYFKARYKHSNE